MIKLIFLSFSLSLSILAKDIPTLSGPVVDQASIYSSSFTNKLSQLLRTIKKQTGAQLQVLTITNLEDEALENYAIKVVDKWKLGNTKNDLGLLFLISIDERKMRIEVGQGLEGVITDILAGRLIDQAKPYFRQGDYEGGTLYIMSNIAKLISGDIKPSRITKKSRKKGIPFLPIIILLLMVFGRGRRGRSSWIYFAGGGGGFSGGGGGGGWSGGGGGFSGGGSSGSW